MKPRGGGTTDYLCIGEHEHFNTSVDTPVAADLTKSFHTCTTATDKAGGEPNPRPPAPPGAARHFFTHIAVGGIHAPDTAVYPTNVLVGTHVHLGIGSGSANVGDFLELMWNGSKWVIVSSINEYS
jgi:hypothetical protein